LAPVFSLARLPIPPHLPKEKAGIEPARLAPLDLEVSDTLTALLCTVLMRGEHWKRFPDGHPIKSHQV